MKRLTAIVLRGLAVIVPIGLTLYVIYWLGVSAEKLLQPLLRPLLEAMGLPYYTGMGVVVGLLAVFLIGLLTSFVLFRKVVELVGALLERIPLVKSLYGGLQDLMSFVRQSRDAESALSQVVVVTVLHDWQMLGFVTRDTFEDVPDKLTPGGDSVAVYLPMSYQIGGFTIFLPREQVEPIDMRVEDAMRFALTAGMSAKKRKDLGGAVKMSRNDERDSPAQD